MKKEMRKKKNNIFSPRNILIGFVVIIALLLIFNYTYTFSKRGLDISRDSELGELYLIKGDDPCNGKCDSQCERCVDKPGSEEGKGCEYIGRHNCDATYGSGEWKNGICNKDSKGNYHCARADDDNYKNNCGSYNCNECSTCVVKDGIPTGCEKDSKKGDPCSNGKGTCENGECKIPQCKSDEECANPQCQKCENEKCVADDKNKDGKTKWCGYMIMPGYCRNGLCHTIFGDY